VPKSQIPQHGGQFLYGCTNRGIWAAREFNGVVVIRSAQPFTMEKLRPMNFVALFLMAFPLTGCGTANVNSTSPALGASSSTAGVVSLNDDGYESAYVHGLRPSWLSMR